MSSLEQRERELFNRFQYLPNSPKREKLYKEWKKIYDAITLRSIK